MHIEEAIATLKDSGRLTLESGRIRYRGPAHAANVQEALTTLRAHRDRALRLLAATVATPEAAPEPLATTLKGMAIEYVDAESRAFWLVADEEDAALLGERRGCVYTAREAQHLFALRDAQNVRAVAEWKDAFNGVIGDFGSTLTSTIDNNLGQGLSSSHAEEDQNSERRNEVLPEDGSHGRQGASRKPHARRAVRVGEARRQAKEVA